MKIEELKVNGCSTIVSLQLPTTLTKLGVIDCFQLTEIVDLNNQNMRELTISCPSVKMIVPLKSRQRLKQFYNKTSSFQLNDIINQQKSKQFKGKKDNLSDIEVPTNFTPLVRKSFISVYD